MRIKLMAAAVFTCLPVITQADTIFGVYAGVGVWAQDYSGAIEYTDQGGIDLEKDFGFGSENNTLMYVAIEHPLPMVPNIKLQRTEMSTTATSMLERDITFDGKSFSSGSNINSVLDLSHTDATFYYEILDNWVSLDVGGTIRVFDGEVSILSEQGNISAQQGISVPLPMLYGKVQFDLPFSGFSLGAEANYLMISDNGVSDISFRAAYESPMRLGAELGYRTFTMKLDDIDELYGEMTIEGPYLALTLHI